MARLKVLIVGGGIGGITATLALRQRGIDVQLFEQAAAFGQVGAGLQVSSNAARILLKLGLGEALKRVATYPDGRDYRGWDTGERLYYTPLGQKAEAHFGSPYYAAHRAELLDVLLSGLGEHGFRLGSRVERVDQDQNGVSLTLADGSIAQGDILDRRRRNSLDRARAIVRQGTAALHGQCCVARPGACRTRSASRSW